MTDPTPALLAAERRAHILATMEREGAVRISQLTEELGAATVTLRRDLAQMEQEGLLQRVHGGASTGPGSCGAWRPPHVVTV
jgi:DeoR/GlpR family transcriptional regulator of sugar metabolism